MKKQRQGRKRIILGLTGSFGSGKTAVAGVFKSFGVKIIDADEIAHRLIKPKSKIYKKIINAFGKNILKKDQTIDRNKLADSVFSDRVLLRRLNRMTHPEIIRMMKDKIRATPAKVILLDAPLLLEVGLSGLVDKLIVVKINRKKQIERLFKKTSLNKNDILKRIRYQMPLSKKIRMADFVIDNSGTIKETRKQTRKIMKQISLASDL